MAYSAARGREIDTEVEVEAEEFRRIGASGLLLDGHAGRVIAEKLGADYGLWEFHLVDGPTMYVGCRIVGEGGLGNYSTIQYLDVRPSNYHQPDRVVAKLSVR